MTAPPRTSGTRGFTLIEMLVVLAVLAIMAAMLAPAAFESIESARESDTSDQMRRIHLAIVGDPSKGNFGYLGDMGRMPATLDELVTQGVSQPTWHTIDGVTEHKGSVGTGWRGPYITGADVTADLFRDAWGLPLSYTSSGGTAGQMISGGPDGQLATAGDNITYPVQVPVRTAGSVIVTAIVNEIPQPAGLTVKVYSTIDGEQSATPTTLSTTTPSAGKPFRFDVPHGTSVIEVSHTAGTTTVTRTTTIDVPAGTQATRTIVMKTSATVAM